MVHVPNINAPTLCATFASQAAKIWHDLKAAQALGIFRQEETITEDLLLDVQKAHPHEVFTFPFSKPHEQFTGADWEWWLTNGKLWLGLLIQAKRLDPVSHKYKGIKKTVGPAKTPQIDLLIDQAAYKGIHPLYFFYNYTPAGLSELSWTCSTLPPLLPQLGCTAAHAFAVKNVLQQGGAGVPKMSAISLPMQCIVCCPALADPDPSLPGRANGVVNRLRALNEGPAAEGEEGPGATPIRALRNEAPLYVRLLLEASPEQRSRVIEELRREVGLIGSLVVIKERRDARLGGEPDL